MHTSFKMLAAGVLATVAAGERTSTTLAQTMVESVTHPCVAGADCLEYKVEDALQTIIDETETNYDGIVADAGDYMEDVLAGIRGLRFQLTDDVNGRADDLIAALTERVDVTLYALGVALANHQQNIDDESVAIAKRLRDLEDEALDQVKPVLGIGKYSDDRPNVEYGRPGYGYGATSHRGRFFAQVEEKNWSARISHFPATFPPSGNPPAAEAIADSHKSQGKVIAEEFGQFLIDEFASFQSGIKDAKERIYAFRDELLADFEAQIDDENHAFEKHTSWQLTYIENYISDAMAGVDRDLDALRANFIQAFMSTLFEIHEQAEGYQRVLLTATANEKRVAFFDTQAALRQGLADALATQRAVWVSSVADEWDAVMAAQAAARARVAAAREGLYELYEDTTSGYAESLGESVREAIQWYNERADHQQDDLNEFISGYYGYKNAEPFNGVVSQGAKQIYGYAGHDFNTVSVLGDRIAVFNDDHMAEFVSTGDSTIAALRVARNNIVATATDANTAAIDFLCNTLDSLIDRITLERRNREASLEATFQDSTFFQSNERERIESGLYDLKDDILAELQELKDWLIGYHGVSTIATGKLWEKIRELTEDWEAAKEGAFIEFNAMQESTKDAWERAAGSADLDCHDSLARKTSDFEAAALDAGERWATAFATAARNYEAAFEHAEETITTAYETKVRALDLRFGALKANVQNVYDFHIWGKLQEDLNAELLNAIAECEAALEGYHADGEEITESFLDAMKVQDERHLDAQDAKAAQCEQAKLDSATAWFGFSDELRAEFTEFQYYESKAFGINVDIVDASYNKGIKAIKRLPIRNWWR